MSMQQMKVILVSPDRELYDLCRSCLKQLSIDGPILELPGSPHGTADLTIWDVSSDPPDPKRDTSAEKSLDLFVVSRQSLSKVRVLPGSSIGLLLKPVKRPILHAFLATAVNTWSNAESLIGGGSLRTDRDDLFQALLEANIRLQECDQDRTNFLSRALHDFRSPLTALQGYCEILIHQSAGPLDPDQIDLLQRMQHSIGRLSKMSRAMFELSVRHNAERKPSLIKTTIDACIQNSVQQIMPIAQNREISVTVDLDPPDTFLYMDPGAIEQVLVNVLENSCKFTPRNGSIEIRGRLTTMDRQLHGTDGEPGERRIIPAYKVEVQDTGMGILQEHLDSVFEEYTSYAGARDRSGGGLGLAICKMFITEHKGHIWAQSDRAGTTMSFVLPAHQEVVTYPPATSVERELVARANS